MFTFKGQQFNTGSTLRCSNFHSILTFAFDFPAWIIPTILSYSVFESPVMIIQGNLMPFLMHTKFTYNSRNFSYVPLLPISAHANRLLMQSLVKHCIVMFKDLGNISNSRIDAQSYLVERKIPCIYFSNLYKQFKCVYTFHNLFITSCSKFCLIKAFIKKVFFQYHIAFILLMPIILNH